MLIELGEYQTKNVKMYKNHNNLQLWNISSIYQLFTYPSSGNLNIISKTTEWDIFPREPFQASIQQLLQLFLQHLTLSFLSSVRCTRTSFFLKYIHTSSAAYSDPSHSCCCFICLTSYTSDLIRVFPLFLLPNASFFLTCYYSNHCYLSILVCP